MGEGMDGWMDAAVGRGLVLLLKGCPCTGFFSGGGRGSGEPSMQQPIDD